MALTVSQRLLIWFFKFVNFFIPWHWLPKYIGAVNLKAFRDELRHKNLHDTYPSTDYQGAAADMQEHPKFLAIRNSDGLYNDANSPRMGCAGMRFGRNVPRKYTKAPTTEEMMTPNPRLISERILKRDAFKPAETLNLLAAAWIQFQVHDWAQHYFKREKLYDVPLPHGDKWSDPNGMKVFATQRDQVLDPLDKECPAYQNENTHWWDASMIYGSSEEETSKLRVACRKTGDGKLTLSKDGNFLPLDPQDSKLISTGFRENWWTGLEILHTLFVKEHNAICTQLRHSNPYWTSDQLFDTARMVNCALMAKIHTVEWTPGILAHPALEVAMNANWWGLMGEKLTNMLGRVSDSEAISGIPGSTTDHHGAPYCLTEEFVAVYRLHPLIPDVVDFFDVSTGKHSSTKNMLSISFEESRSPFEKDGLDMASVLYSFGINNPGALTHNNMGDFMRDLNAPDRDGKNTRHIDMGVVDILRDRERGVPRYNQFRRLFHMKPARSFNALTGGNKLLARELEEVYGGDIEKVDLVVGCQCEPLPKGFGFSDTQFRVFILMASRRLKSDRFTATDFTPEVYTREGMDWVQKTTMRDVLLRHHPELRPALKNCKNAFAPWDKIGKTVGFPLQKSSPSVNGEVRRVNGFV